MPQRHWVIAYNEQTDECRFMQWLEEWMPFKYSADHEDVQPEWQQFGIYESREHAYEAFIEYSEVNNSREFL